MQNALYEQVLGCANLVSLTALFLPELLPMQLVTLAGVICFLDWSLPRLRALIARYAFRKVEPEQDLSKSRKKRSKPKRSKPKRQKKRRRRRKKKR